MNVKNILIGVALILCSGLANANDSQDALRRFFDGVHDFTADFTQVQSDEHGRTLQSTSGHMWLSRPDAEAGIKVGRFRWDYRKPYQQLLVCDGRKVWIYDADLDQVTVRSAGATLQGTPAALLSQRSALADAFTLQDAGDDGKLRVVRLVPKSAAGDFKAIELSLKQGVPQRMVFFDQLGGKTVVSFSGIEVNRAPDAKLFHFDPPKGTEVIDAAGPASR